MNCLGVLRGVSGAVTRRRGDTAEATQGKRGDDGSRQGRGARVGLGLGPGGGSIRGPPAAMGQRLRGVEARVVQVNACRIYSAAASFCVRHCSTSLVLVTGT